MEPIFIGATFFFGAVFASFIGLVVARLSTGASIVSGRSKCDVCGEDLGPISLIPIISWFLTFGRCLTCKTRVSPLMPVSEFALGVLFALAYLKIGATLALPFMLIALTLVLGIVWYDFEHTIIPPVLLWPLIACALIVAVLSAPDLTALLLVVYPALLMGSSLALIHLASSGRAMGFADAPFTLGLALLVGPTAFTGFVFSFWIGGLFGIIQLVRRALGTTIEREVPFAPFLAAGFLLAYFTSWDLFSFSDQLSSLFGA